MRNSLKDEKLLEKLLTLAWFVSGTSVSITQFFSSCQLLAQNWILNTYWVIEGLNGVVAFTVIG